MIASQLSRYSHRLIDVGSAVVVLLFIAGCSNSTPDVRQNSAAPTLASKGLTISDLDASADVTGSCQDIGKLDKGFEIQLDGSTWLSKHDVVCTNGSFKIRVEKLGRSMLFHLNTRGTKNARVRRTSITGKSSEIDVAVNYIPDVAPGSVAEGGGTEASGKYILRGSFSGTQKETGSTFVTSDAKFKMVLSRDKDRR